ncbi:MAG: small GTP-binding protein [Promethearchaeota archaeon CR_4]|nr:MAG: small GTP-binding protein [Candidatus Lokiarchaeota archaeon CR_4]
MVVKFKILVAGNKSVGKTTLVRRYCTGVFQTDTLSTIGVDFMVKEVKIGNEDVSFSIWDFAGEKKFRQLLPAYCSGASGALLLFDLTNAESMEELDAWVEVIDRNAPDISKVLVGTKADLVANRQVPKRLAEEIMSKYKMIGFWETSSKTGENVEDVFQALGAEILKRSLRRCPYCDHLVPKELYFCQFCGKKLINNSV